MIFGVCGGRRLMGFGPSATMILPASPEQIQRKASGHDLEGEEREPRNNEQKYYHRGSAGSSDFFRGRSSEWAGTKNSRAAASGEPFVLAWSLPYSWISPRNDLPVRRPHRATRDLTEASRPCFLNCLKHFFTVGKLRDLRKARSWEPVVSESPFLLPAGEPFHQVSGG